LTALLILVLVRRFRRIFEAAGFEWPAWPIVCSCSAGVAGVTAGWFAGRAVRESVGVSAVRTTGPRVPLQPVQRPRRANACQTDLESKRECDQKERYCRGDRNLGQHSRVLADQRRRIHTTAKHS
jgi:hypothetical protein